MIVKENHCVDCGLPCYGAACPNRNVEVVYCDECGGYADFCLDDNDLCEKCAEFYIKESWDGLSVQEKSKLLNITCEPYK